MQMISRSYDDIQVLELRGRFDAHTSATVKDWQDRTASPAVIVNLAGVNFVDSGALAVLIRGMKRCRQDGGELRLCCLQQPVQIIFELTKMHRAFAIYESEEDALSAFRN